MAVHSFCATAALQRSKESSAVDSDSATYECKLVADDFGGEKVYCKFSNRSSFLSAETWESSLRSLQDAAAEDPDKILASIQLQTVALL